MTDCQSGKQAPRGFRRKSTTILTLVLLGVAVSTILSACGKKPGSVDPPPYVTDDKFPYVYPDPATDPKP